MNLAFQALVLLLLALPGALFLFAHFGRMGASKELPVTTPFSTQSVFALVFASALHAFWVWITNLAILDEGLEVDLHSVLFLLMGDYDDTDARAHAIAAILTHPYRVFFYFVTLYVASFSVGWISHRIVRYCRLDHKFRVFRFSDLWHYMFTAEVLHFSEFGYMDVDDEIDGAAIAAVMEVGGAQVLYVGFLEAYWYGQDGKLDAIWLSSVFRRKLEDDRQNTEEVPPEDLSEDDRYYPIEGDFFVLKFADLKNLNIRYIYLEEEDPRDPSGASNSSKEPQ